MKLNYQFKNIQQIHLSIESMSTIGLTGFLVLMVLLLPILPREEIELEAPSTINLTMPKLPKDTIVYTDDLLPKENLSKP